ncbi:hypothetical protein RclHR1_02210018 [Rhizophagus clarus]|uniref:Postreplication repair E3 ubiquitin-protein ligase RAD18 n=1 Tax=Rhizophagus clarus TaxID=94130 RepID=A0A2Z6QTH3_9GLOM|nr:hypothetical protein RclHR1_02210018 [Rhizophagus clarus]GET00197.1 DNA repair protein rad18 [Rhizophagus clarus]
MLTPPPSTSTSYISDNSITDPTEFSHKSLQSIDTVSRCPICKDFLNTPTVGECGHIYCSFCVLRTLAIERNCPICKTKLSDHQLFKSIATEKIVNCWKNIRETILRGAKEECRKKRIRDYMQKSKKMNSVRTTHLNPRNRYTSCTNGKNVGKLEYAYLHNSDLISSQSDYDEKLKFCIQQ